MRRRAAAFAVSAAACLAASACDAPPPAPQPTVRVAPVAALPALPVFVDVATEAGLVAANHTGVPDVKDWLAGAMGGGAIVLDYDQDGRMDLVVVDGTMLTSAGKLEYDDEWRTRVFHNDGGMKFTDVTKKSGVDIKGFGVGGAACDYDADGFPDFYVCSWGRNHLMHNRGDGTFEDVSETSGPAMQETRVWRGAAFADYDDDGDLDVFLTALNDRCGLFRNDGGERNGFLVLRLVGKGGLRDPSGARVTVYLADGKPHLEELHHGISFCGDNDPRFFFGLGAQRAAERVEVRWPDGETRTFDDVAGRAAYVLEQGKKKLRKDVR